MAYTLDGAVSIDAGAKLVELQREWERSRAFLEELESCFSDRSPGISNPGRHPTAWAPADEDAAPLTAPEPAGAAPLHHVQSSSAVRGRRGSCDATPASDACELRRLAVRQVNIRFRSSADEPGVELAAAEDASAPWHGPPLSRQPKPSPPLQRSGSLRQRGAPPVNRARILRAATFDNSGIDSVRDSSSISSSGGGISCWAGGQIAELASQHTRPALAGTTPPAYAAAGAASTTGAVASAAQGAQCGLLEAGAALRPMRRFSMDFEQRRGGGGGRSGGGASGGGVGIGLPALAPTVLGFTPQRRVSVAAPGWGSEEAAKAGVTAGGGGGSGGTLSFRRLESGGFAAAGGSGGGDAASRDSSGGSARYSFSGEKRSSVSGGGGGGAPPDLVLSYGRPAAPVASPPTSTELPSLPLGRLSAAANVNVNLDGAALYGPADSGRQAQAPSRYRLRSSQSFPSSGRLEAGSGGGDGGSSGGGGGGDTPSVPEDGAAPAVPARSLSPRAGQPRAMIGQQAFLRREWQQLQSSQQLLQPPPPQQQQLLPLGHAWDVYSSSDSAAHGPPRAAASADHATTAAAAAALRASGPVSLQWPQELSEKGLRQLETGAQAQVQPHAPEAAPIGYGPRYCHHPARVVSHVALRLQGIPETAAEGGAMEAALAAGSSATRRLMPQRSEPGYALVVSRLSSCGGGGSTSASGATGSSGGSGGGGGGSGEGNGGRVACEVFRGGQGGARRAPRFSWGVEAFSGGVISDQGRD